MLIIIALVIFDLAFIIYVARLVAPARQTNYAVAPRARHSHDSVFDDTENYVPSSRQSRQAKWERDMEDAETLTNDTDARNMDSHRRNMFAG